MSQHIALTTPAQIEGARLLAIRSALRIEVRTGMKLSRGRSALVLAREAGMTEARNKSRALADVDAYIEKHVLPKK